MRQPESSSRQGWGHKRPFGLPAVTRGILVLLPPLNKRGRDEPGHDSRGGLT
jgi:hypothetical protein